MRRFLAMVVILCVGIAVGRLSSQQRVNAEGAGAADDSSCGDMNDDDKIDISDAVYLLSWLFTGGPAPKCPSNGTALVGLSDTGQTTCYDAEGNVVDCASDTCAGQDGFYQTGCSNEGRFVDNEDGTVTDTCTGLMWQRRTADTNGDGKIDELTWQEALQFCEGLQFADYTDWRLPNIRELQSIVDYGRLNPSIDTESFSATSSSYWSSSTRVFLPYGAWVVNFDRGNAAGSHKELVSLYVRAVRTIQPGE